MALKDQNDETIKNKNTLNGPGNETIKNENGIDEPINETIDKRLTPLVELLRMNPEMTIGELSEALGKDPSTIKRWLKTLKNSDYIDRTGSKKAGSWEVLKEI